MKNCLFLHEKKNFFGFFLLLLLNWKIYLKLNILKEEQCLEENNIIFTFIVNSLDSETISLFNFLFVFFLSVYLVLSAKRKHCHIYVIRQPILQYILWFWKVNYIWKLHTSTANVRQIVLGVRWRQRLGEVNSKWQFIGKESRIKWVETNKNFIFTLIVWVRWWINAKLNLNYILVVNLVSDYNYIVSSDFNIIGII